MPNCFTLTSKATGKTEAFSKIDEDICAHLGVEVDPVEYVHGWYDSIGLGLAVGKSFDEMLEIFKEPETIKIVNFLKDHYTSDAWYETRR